MNSRTIDGCLITRPSRDDVERLSVGDLAPTCFGTMATVTSITYRGIGITGKAYVGYYTEFGDGATISGSMTEGEPVATLPAGDRYKTIDCYPKF